MAQGQVYLLDKGDTGGGNRIVFLDVNGNQSTLDAASVGDPLGQIKSLTAFTVDGPGNLYLGGSTAAGATIERVDRYGNGTTVGTPAATSAALAIDGFHDVYSVDTSGNLVEFIPGGTPKTFSAKLPFATSLSIDASNTVSATEVGGTAVSVVAPDGTTRSVILAGVAKPTAVAVDFFGDLYVADGTTQQLFSKYFQQSNLSFGTVANNTTATLTDTVTNVGNLPLAPGAAPTVASPFYFHLRGHQRMPVQRRHQPDHSYNGPVLLDPVSICPYEDRPELRAGLLHLFSQRLQQYYEQLYLHLQPQRDSRHEYRVAQHLAHLADVPFNHAGQYQRHADLDLSASGLPAGATASFAPASVTPGAAAVGSVMTVNIPVLKSSNRDATFGGHGRSPVFFSATLFLAMLLGGKRRLRSRLSERVMLLLLLLVVLSATLTGCSSSTGFAVPQSTSTITITGTSGTLVHTTTVTLTLK